MPWAAKKQKYISPTQRQGKKKWTTNVKHATKGQKLRVFNATPRTEYCKKKKEVNNEKRDWYEGEERFQIKNKFHVLSYLAGSIAEL